MINYLKQLWGLLSLKGVATFLLFLQLRGRSKFIGLSSLQVLFESLHLFFDLLSLFILLTSCLARFFKLNWYLVVLFILKFAFILREWTIFFLFENCLLFKAEKSWFKVTAFKCAVRLLGSLSNGSLVLNIIRNQN